MTYQSLVSFEYWTFIAQLLNFFLQIYLFKRFLFEPVKKIVKQRQEKADSVIKEAEAAKAQALAEKESYDEQLRNARKDANEITARAIDSANIRSEQIIDEARKEARTTLDKAQQAIELDRQKAMNEARKEISGMAVELASKLISKEISEDDNRALIDSFIDEYGKEK